MASHTLTSTIPRPSPPSSTDDVKQLSAPAIRWLLRLGYAAPLCAAAAIGSAHGYRDGANTALIRQAHDISWGSNDLSFVRHVYPVIPTALARLVPHLAGLALLGAIAGGVLLEAVHHRARSTGLHPLAATALVLLLALTPGLAFTATTDLAAFLAIALIATALDGFYRFIHDGHTHGGFIAGLALGLAGLCDPAAIIVAVAFALAAPLIAAHRYAGRHAAGRATAAVLLFPTLAGLSGWTYLCWRYSGSPLAWLHTSAPGLFHLGSITEISHRAWQTTEQPLLLTPVLFAVVAITALRARPVAALGLLIPALAVVLAAGLGLGLPPGATAALLGVFAIGSLPAAMSRHLTVGLLTVAAAGLILKWIYASSPALTVWEHTVTH